MGRAELKENHSKEIPQHPTLSALQLRSLNIGHFFFERRRFHHLAMVRFWTRAWSACDWHPEGRITSCLLEFCVHYIACIRAMGRVPLTLVLGNTQHVHVLFPFQTLAFPYW